MRGKARRIAGLIILGCGAMALVETLLEPPYAVKSGLKILIFLVVPLVYLKAKGETGFRRLLIPDKKGLARSLLLGTAVYGAIMAAFLLTRNVFDYGRIVDLLAQDQGVGRGSFLLVAAYISFGNSLLEEFFFRAIAFLKLSAYAGRRAAYAFSACLFAVYHIAMIASSFPVPLLLLALLGLAAGGGIFCWLDERSGNIYHSWMVHIFADLALMTIWLLALSA